MESKSIDEYFNMAKKMPLATSFDDVTSLVRAKGASSPPKKSWWNLNNIIIMTTTTILTSAILVYNLTTTTPVKSTYSSIKLSHENNYKPNFEKHKTLLSGSQDTNNEKAVSVIEDDTTNLSNEQPSRSFEVIASHIKVNSEKSIFESHDLLRPNNKPEYLPKNVDYSEYENSEELIDTTKDSKLLIKKVDGETKTVTQSIDAGNLKTFMLKNENGKINVETWDKPTVEVTAYFTLKADEPEDVIKGLADFKLNLNAEGSKAVVSTNWDKFNNCSGNSESTWAKNGLLKLLFFSSKNTAKTEEGEKLDYEKFSIEYSVKIPAFFNVDLSNNYGNIELQTIEGVADIKVFEGDFKAKDMKELSLNLKYGSAEVNNFESGIVEGFESKIILGNANHINLEVKYSNVQIGEVEALNIKGFETNLTGNGAIKNIKGNWKYGSLELKVDAEKVELVTFETPFTAQNIDFLTISLKYGKLTANAITHLELTESFESTIKLAAVEDLKGDLKYSPLKIDLLRSGMDITSFEGEVTVNKVESDFTRLNLKTKYTNINIKFDPNSNYDLEAETTYSKLIFPQGFVIKKQQESTISNKNYYLGSFNNTITKEASKVYLNSFEGKLIFE